MTNWSKLDKNYINNKGRKSASAPNRTPGYTQMSTSQDHYQLTKIARLYYQENKNLREIAGRLNVSMATVSRALVAARKSGIVDIRINDVSSEYREMEIRLEQGLGVQECMIVPSSTVTENTYAELAKAAELLFPRLLRPGALVGFSWGVTLKSVADHLNGNLHLNVDTVPLVGAMGTVETGVFPNAIARTYADRVGGRSYLVNAPAILDSKHARELIEGESSFQPILGLWNRLDVVVVSVSGLDDNASLLKLGVIGQEEMGILKEAGAVCATNFIMLDRDGREVRTDLNERMIRASLSHLMRAKHRVLIAFGSDKLAAIKSAAAARIATTFLTDLDTARKLSAEL